MKFQERVKQFERIAEERGSHKVVWRIERALWRIGLRTKPLVCQSNAVVFALVWLPMFLLGCMISRPLDSILPIGAMITDAILASLLATYTVYAMRRRFGDQSKWLLAWNSLDENRAQS